MKRHSGFTLVELAIVMMIIGFLVGGVLKGQELMNNSRVTATIAQMRGYQAAVTTFRDKYSQYPGDMPYANGKIPGCVAACDPTPLTAGNSVIGDPAWGANGFLSQSGVAPAAALVGGSVGNETVLFWAHLMFADLISGVTNAAVTGAIASWGETHPGAKVGGGFIVGWGDGTRNPGAPPGVVGTSGLLLILAMQPSATLGTTAGQQPLTPSRTAQIDRKVDDGDPVGGYLQAFGFTSGCFNGVFPNLVYLESRTSQDCGFSYRIEG